MPRAVRETETRGADRQVVIDEPEPLLGARLFDRRPERAEDAVDRECVRVALHLAEVEHMLFEIRVMNAGRTARDDDDTLPGVEELMEKLASDEAGRAEKE